MTRALSAGVLALLALAALPRGAAAQEPWNGPRVRALVERARDVRQRTVSTDGLESYAADARGYVYFFLDQEEADERNLVKTDQIALEVFWRAPDQTRQRIVGLRDARSLPTNVQYHLDHLTVVQDDFADRIRLGDGDEVSAVVHPLAPGAESVYDFRLGDSLTIRFQPPADPVRVYEIQVRPSDPDRPGIVGSVFVDRASAAVVRMRFTFTAASYVDPYLDYIRISLDNALWDGRYWLPYQQNVEIRRESPLLDLPFGSVIRGRYRISNYRINQAMPPDLFFGPGVTAVPEAVRRAFPFEQGLYAEIEEEGLSSEPDLDAIREQATDLVRERTLNGLAPARVSIPDVSSVVRYNRAEGGFLGAGLAFRPSGFPRIRIKGGYGFGRKQGQGTVSLGGGDQWPGSSASVFLNTPRDIGPIQAASGFGNTTNSLFEQRDFQDLYFVSGLSLGQAFDLSPAWTLGVTTRWERQRTATDVVSDSGDVRFRPVLAAEEGDLLALDLGLDWTGPLGLGGDALLTVATFDGDPVNRLRGGVSWTRERLEGRRHRIRARLEGGALSVDGPPQLHFLLGGRRTLPGYDFRSSAGDRYWHAWTDARVALAWPWVSGRVFAAAGSTALRDPDPAAWLADAHTGTRVSVGLGVDVLWDVVRLEWGRGLSDGGRWEFNGYVSARFWPVL